MKELVERWRRRVLTVATVAASASCMPEMHVSRDEVARVEAPNGRVEAILIQTNGGATTSFGYEVRLVPKGSRTGPLVAELYGAARNDSAYGANLRWADATLLAVEYQEAFSDTVLLAEATVAGERIRTVLRPGVVDPHAPAGGMLWNLGGRKP